MLALPPLPTFAFRRLARRTIFCALLGSALTLHATPLHNANTNHLLNDVKLVSVQGDESHFRQSLAGIGQNYTGIHYVLGGRNTKGFDCSGFTAYVYNEFGCTLEAQARAQADFGEPISLAAARPGDLVFFGRGGHIQHVSLIVSNDKDGITVVHATSSRGVVVENITNSRYWSPKLLFARNVINRLVEFVSTPAATMLRGATTRTKSQIRKENLPKHYFNTQEDDEDANSYSSHGQQ